MCRLPLLSLYLSLSLLLSDILLFFTSIVLMFRIENNRSSHLFFPRGAKSCSINTKKRRRVLQLEWNNINNNK